MKEISFEKAVELIFIPWYLRILGFNIETKVQMQDEPTQSGSYWVYKVKFRYIFYKWLWFKIKIFKIIDKEDLI